MQPALALAFPLPLQIQIALDKLSAGAPCSPARLARCEAAATIRQRTARNSTLAELEDYLRARRAVARCLQPGDQGLLVW
jgi:hypothetical protein